jgi:hypothetical protein
MSGQEQAPSFGRFRSLGNSIVQVLVDIRRGDWVDGNHAHISIWKREHLADDDVDAIKPSKLCDAVTGQRRIPIDHGERQNERQNERVFPTKAHAARSSPKCRIPLRPWPIQLGCEFGGRVDWWTRRPKWAWFEIVIVKSAVKPDPQLSRPL